MRQRLACPQWILTGWSLSSFASMVLDMRDVQVMLWIVALKQVPVSFLKHATPQISIKVEVVDSMTD